VHLCVFAGPAGPAPLERQRWHVQPASYPLQERCCALEQQVGSLRDALRDMAQEREVRVPGCVCVRVCVCVCACVCVCVRACMRIRTHHAILLNSRIAGRATCDHQLTVDSISCHHPSTLQVVIPGPNGSRTQRGFQFHACMG